MAKPATFFLLASLGIAAGVQAEAANMNFQCRFDRMCDETGCKADDLSVHYILDSVTKSAVAVGADGNTPAFAFEGQGGVSFLETLPTGGAQSTTIEVDGRAVHSRHAFLPEGLSASQHYGVCGLRRG